METPPPERLTWREICDRYFDEWVCLVEIEWGVDRWIATARVVSHDQSVDIAQATAPANPDTLIVNTAGRPLWRRPRLWVPDEDRDAFPPRS